MSRIPYPDLEALSPIKHAKIHDPKRKHVLNVSKMALHMSDAMWQAYANLGSATVNGIQMDRRLRELVIVRLGYLQQSEYELYHHGSIARSLGVTEVELEALQGGDLDVLAPADRAMVDFASEVLRDVSPSDETLARMREYYPDWMLFETIGLIGSYMIMARIAAVGGIELEPEPVSAW